MKALFRNSLIASLCAAAGIMVGSSNVLAQTVDVPFNGNVPNTCTFGAPTDGTFEQSVNSIAVEASGGIGGMAYGTAGTVTLDCAAGGSVTVGLPTNPTIPVGFNTPTLQSVVSLDGVEATSVINFSGTQYWTNFTSTGALSVPAGEQDLFIAAYAGDGAVGSLPVGSYSYTVTLTATPD